MTPIFHAITTTGVETEKFHWVQTGVVNMWTTSRMPPSDTGNCRAALEFKIPTLEKRSGRARGSSKFGPRIRWFRSSGGTVVVNGHMTENHGTSSREQC